MAKLVGHTRYPMFRLFLRSGGWVVLVGAVLMLFLTLISAVTLRLAERFDAEGLATVGKIDDKYQEVTTDSDGDREVNYYLDISFFTATDEQVFVTRSVGNAQYRAAQVGAPIDVFYLQSEPEKIELRRGENRSTSNVTRTISLVIGVISLVALWFSGRRAVAGARARKFGTRYLARVVERKRTNWSVNRQVCERLVWHRPDGTPEESLLYPARPG